MPYRRGIPGDYTQRDKEICALHASGLSCDKIGERYNPPLSRERVRQIVGKARRRNEHSDRFNRLADAFKRGGLSGRGNGPA